MSKKDMILALIEHYSNGNKAQFASLLGISPQGLSTWIKRESFDIELIFSKCEHLSAQWLLTGEGPMLKQDLSNNQTNGEIISKMPQKSSVSQNPAVGVPYYDVDFIGGFTEIFDNQTTIPTCNVLVPGFEKASLWCNVTGHSMEPKINHGDIIALHECTINDIQFGEIYAVVLDTIRTIKILRRGSTPDKLLYVPINKPDYEEQEFDVSRIVRIFEILGSVAKFF